MIKLSESSQSDEPMAFEALKCAAKEARRIGRATKTPVWVWRDGKIVDALASKTRVAKKRK
jgi:hypothetical protein